MSPEKGGALRNQSTGGRRLGVAAVLCGVLFGLPLLLLHNQTARASRVRTASPVLRAAAQGVTGHASRWGGPEVASRRVSARGRIDDDNDGRADNHDDGSADDNDDRAATADHDDDNGPPAASDDDHNDAARANEFGNGPGDVVRGGA